MADTDNATVALILQLLNEDGQTATADLFGKGKQAAGTETDAQMAMRLFLEEEVQGLGAFVTDRTMAISMQTAVCLDAEMCMMAEKQERMAAHDRGLSLSLGDHDGLGPQGDAPGTPATFDDDDLQQSIEKMACIYVNGLHEGGTGNMATFFDETGDDTHSTIGDQPESSKWAASRKRLERGDQRPSHKCNSCLESKSFAEVAAVPCRHEYCRDCLQQLFRHSMTDEAYFPPRCCKLAIRPGHQISLYLTGQLVREYERKAIEYSTPRRTYCHEPSCAAFIPPDKCSDTVATCTLCTRQTCTTCKQASHGGDCPSDGALQEVIQLARDRGWQRCGKCWSMVELEMGCNHMRYVENADDLGFVHRIYADCRCISGAVVADVASSSATSAVHSGRPVDASSGMSAASLSEPSRLMLGSIIGLITLPEKLLMSCRKSLPLWMNQRKRFFRVLTLRWRSCRLRLRPRLKLPRYLTWFVYSQFDASQNSWRVFG